MGWITIASIANVAVVLTAVDWDTGGIDLVSWAALMIAVALLIALVVIAKRKDVAYGLVIVWALG
ncbi:MAG: tryptophan-rich sensory protein, partial [Candidatus Bathyarchaeota archaeon]|nr:tryptophan-rich sensory protein [Candidatus Bathyarchaeota archaeon]